MPQTWQDFSSMLFLSSSRGQNLWILDHILDLPAVAFPSVPWVSDCTCAFRSQLRMGVGFDIGLLLEFSLSLSCLSGILLSPVRLLPFSWTLFLSFCAADWKVAGPCGAHPARFPFWRVMTPPPPLCLLLVTLQTVVFFILLKVYDF